MYYFDVATRTCSSFLFGGCKGNENRFSSLEECQSSCGDFMAARNLNDAKSGCELDRAPGKCRGFQKKFYFKYILIKKFKLDRKKLREKIKISDIY